MYKTAVRRIMAAQRAQNTGKSEWAKQYWARVERELRIKYKYVLEDNTK